MPGDDSANGFFGADVRIIFGPEFGQPVEYALEGFVKGAERPSQSLTVLAGFS